MKKKRFRYWRAWLWLRPQLLLLGPFPSLQLFRFLLRLRLCRLLALFRAVRHRRPRRDRRSIGESIERGRRWRSLRGIQFQRSSKRGKPSWECWLSGLDAFSAPCFRWWKKAPQSVAEEPFTEECWMQIEFDILEKLHPRAA